MSDKVARADVAQLRQTTQFTCCATSITSALHALGKKYTEDDVNKYAKPMADEHQSKADFEDTEWD